MTQKRVLIIEDILENRVLLKPILEPLGYLCLEADTGEKGVQMVEQETFDLILADIGLPKLNGVQATWQMRNKGIQTPIIIVSAYLSKWDRDDIFDCGADAIIAKPIEKSDLIRTIEEVLAKKKGG